MNTIKTTVFINGDESVPRYSLSALLIALHVAASWFQPLRAEMLLQSTHSDFRDPRSTGLSFSAPPPNLKIFN